jgi:hypothetical protein
MGPYDELYVWSMSRPGFLLQHVADAQAAQMASAGTKPIGIVIPLVGLCLFLEHGFDGHRVQQVHMQMGRAKSEWPAVRLPETRGEMTAADVLAHQDDAARELAVAAWCRGVWEAYAGARPAILELLRRYEVLP